MKAKIILLFLFLVSVVSCTHTQKESVRKLEVGMSKADVLEVMGNPTRTNRSHGSDRWVYEYEVNGQKEVTEVYFQEGKASYFGKPKDPKSPVNSPEQGFRDVKGTEEQAK